jgi:hypothetical protein
MALGKALLCRVLGSRQSTVLGKELTGYLPLVFAKCYRLTLGKDFFLFLASKLFLLALHIILKCVFKFGTFLDLFAIYL